MKFYLRRIRLNSGSYTYGKFGKYYGTGLPLYQYDSIDSETSKHYGGMIRADSRQDARQQISDNYPGAKFFR